MQTRQANAQSTAGITDQVNALIDTQLQQAAQAQRRREYEQAYDLYRSVLDSEPRNLRALLGLAQVVTHWGMHDIAVESLNTALQLNANHVAVNQTLAQVYARMRCYGQAIRHYRKVIALQPDNAWAHGELARLYCQSGSLDHARKHYRHAFALSPQEPAYIHGLLQSGERVITPDMIATIERILSDDALDLDKRSRFHFALGEIHDRDARFNEAFANYTVANIARGDRYDAQAHQCHVDALIQTFDKALFENHASSVRAPSDHTAPVPVFIVTMPCTGADRVVQMLAAHDAVYDVGEPGRIERIARSLGAMAEPRQSYPQCVPQLPAQVLQQVAASHQRYLQHLSGQGSVAYIVDSSLANFLHLGLIALLFPQAKIIHVQRNPLDTCLACFFHDFDGSQPYASDLLHVGHYYRQYQRLMQHWQQVLPVSIIDVPIEKWMHDSESAAQTLLASLDLVWQSQCLPALADKAGTGAGRKDDTSGRWQYYEQFLHGLKRVLGMDDIGDALSALRRTPLLDWQAHRRAVQPACNDAMKTRGYRSCP